MTAKDTKRLENEIAESESVSRFLADNQENLRKYTQTEYLNELLNKKNISKADAIKRSKLDQVYGYHIFSGRKKKSSRTKILSLAIGMELTPQETQYLLYYSGLEQLYVRSPWDSVLWFALEKRLSVDETNEILRGLSLEPLLGQQEEP